MKSHPLIALLTLSLITFGLALVTRWAGGASAYPPASAACNRPASDMPPAPDGCPDYAPIAPPPAPIPLPCITTAQAEQWDEGGTIVTELRIHIDHPELSSNARTYTKLARYQFRNSQSEIRNSEWELVDANWEVSCGKDEGPLVWALFEVLNAGRWDALSIYTSPLPEEYMAVLRDLAGLRHFTYLPYLEVQP